MPYVATVAQGAVLRRALSDWDIQEMQQTGREVLIEGIYQAICNREQPLEEENSLYTKLSEAYWSNRFCQADGGYVMSCYAEQALDELSVSNSR